MGYDLRPDLVEAMATLLDGRELLFVSTHAWGAFLWEQLAFCRALEQHGARGRAWVDCPIETLGRDWQPPMFGVAAKTPAWNSDVPKRIHEDGWARFIVQNPEFFAKAGFSDAVIFRFGYFDCFSHEVLEQLHKLESRGTTCLNPTHFAFDSKAVLAALHLPSVRAHIGAAHIDVLDRAIPETHVLMQAETHRFLDDKDAWVLKFAGFDAGQQAWGGRSLQIGAQLAQREWDGVFGRYCDLPFPVVIQRATPTATLDIDYFDATGAVQTLHGNARIRSFFVRDSTGNNVRACGTHLTLSDGAGVSESMSAVQAPVVFVD